MLTTGSADWPDPRVQAPLGADAADTFEGAETPERRSFVGYYGGEFQFHDVWWCVLYLDWDLRTWLIIERDGVVARESMIHEPGLQQGRDVLWVKADAAVGRGRRSLSREGEFLTGAFTRAGDFDVGQEGGTLAAATGVFCDARSVGCCMGRTNRPPGS